MAPAHTEPRRHAHPSPPAASSTRRPPLPSRVAVRAVDRDADRELRRRRQCVSRLGPRLWRPQRSHVRQLQHRYDSSFWVHFSRTSPLHTTPHNPKPRRVLIGVWNNPMVCPIWDFTGSSWAIQTSHSPCSPGPPQNRCVRTPPLPGRIGGGTHSNEHTHTLTHSHTHTLPHTSAHLHTHILTHTPTHPHTHPHTHTHTCALAHPVELHSYTQPILSSFPFFFSSALLLPAFAHSGRA